MKTDSAPVFLTAEWRHLAMLNYEADPKLLAPFVPSGTELDLWNGKNFVSVVGLFVNAPQTEIESVLSKVRLDILQYHGDETAHDCEQINLPYYKAIRVKADTNLLQYEAEFKSAKALLLDTFSEAAVGGTGQVFDWKLIPKNMTKPVILAGGLTAENVADAIQQVRPYAVDVSGGVEATKGIKDAAKIAAFMQAVAKFRS